MTTTGLYQVANPDDNELYVFNRNGVHLRTSNVITGAAVYTLSYDAAGDSLQSVTDVHNNSLTIDYFNVSKGEILMITVKRQFCFGMQKSLVYS